ncbi:DUF2849 domain-containing protein [Celeribacter indicus]|uniref:Sulfite reductase n=1 Tax=Celeribacter indicus TaxID=1208324 RepID=A0A0B5DXK0_9RHOB|nr:DUF2849 domain-containing protein [Celeribacter indicus]AJE47714.1 hypothetical protein P73_2999 [Celeribacter indicus]SDW15016.1 Protein of unknown function [Celeribacter indicus]
MPRPFTPKAITANALLEGDVIYLSATGEWVRALSDAAVFTEQAAAEAALAEAAKDRMVVGAYLTDVAPGENGPEPTHFREDFRRTGPSNYFHGKQEAAANV